MTFSQLIDQVPDRKHRDFALKGPQPIAALTLEPAHPRDERLHSRRQLLERGLVARTDRLRKLGELRRRHRMRIAKRDGRQTRGRQLERDPPHARLLAQFVQCALLLSLERLGRLPLALRVRRRLERRHQLTPRVGEEPVHVGLELVRAPARERQRQRRPGVTKVVQVDPIARCRPAAGELVHTQLQRGPLAGTDRSGDEDVVAGHPGLEPELDRFVGPGLPDRRFERLHFCGRGEAEGLSIAPAPQRTRAEFLRVRLGHRVLSLLRGSVVRVTDQ